MTTADQLKPDQEFIGVMDYEDYKRIGKYRRVPGELIHVHFISVAHCQDGVRSMMKLLAGLPHDNALQLSGGDYAWIWVCGQRNGRSKTCWVFDWALRCADPLGALMPRRATP